MYTKVEDLARVILDGCAAHVVVSEERYELFRSLSLLHKNYSFLFSRYAHNNAAVNDCLHWLDETAADIVAQCYDRHALFGRPLDEFAVHGYTFNLGVFYNVLDKVSDLYSEEYSVESAGEAYEWLFRFFFMSMKADTRFAEEVL